MAGVNTGAVPRALSRSDIASLAESLAKLLAFVRSGEMDASVAMTYRIEGAVVALQAVLGADREAILERLANPP